MPPNYQIIVDRVHHTDTLDVQVEMSPEMFSDTVKDISAKENELVADMKSMLSISPKVTLVAPRSIARSEGKAVRVIDRRKI
jgi:phenylacetate-CoA ligase